MVPTSTSSPAARPVACIAGRTTHPGRGITAPGDLAPLRGDNLVGALEADTAHTWPAGVRVTTDVPGAPCVPDRAAAALRSGGSGLPVLRQVGRLAVDGTLGDREAFRALPDVEEAAAALWIDPVRRVTGRSRGRGAGRVDEDLAPVAGVGARVRGGNGDAAAFRVRLVAR